MNTALTILLSVWLFLLVAAIVLVIIILMMPKVFKLRANLNRADRKQIKHTITASSFADYKHNLLFRTSIYVSMLSILVYIFDLLAMLLGHFMLAMGLLVLSAVLYPFLGIVLPSFQYKYWSKHESSDFTLLAQDKFSKFIILRVILTVCVIVLFLLPVVFHEQFLAILVAVLSKVMGY